ncbi:MAG TPA: UDP-glucose 4-epimerase GalE [Bacteroidetes bacterium]|nr:UDP-glucose 4-epimerase GalE [Bacteroidota bacterium]
MKKKVLVTGGTGFIGSHTVVELIENGYETILIDNLHNSEAIVAQRIGDITGVVPQLEIIDMRDKAAMGKFFAMQGSSIDAVIHFAAFKSVGESARKPLDYYYNNLVSLLNLLEETRKHGIKSLVFSSSCTVYGQPDKLPVSEVSPLKPAMSPYGRTKKICEDILADTVEAVKELKVVSLRYFNPIGAHPSALIGELPRGIPENLVPFITQTAIGIREELKVYGDDYDTPDGSCIRDYIHVVDLAKAHVSALHRLVNNKNKTNFEVFNIGTGKGVSVFEAIESFQRVSGVKLKYRIIGRRSGDIEKIWADTSLANSELGWKAESTVDDAMKTAWEWEKSLRGGK